jgi:hypothetical protein
VVQMAAFAGCAKVFAQSLCSPMPTPPLTKTENSPTEAPFAALLAAPKAASFQASGFSRTVLPEWSTFPSGARQWRGSVP